MDLESVTPSPLPIVENWGRARTGSNTGQDIKSSSSSSSSSSSNSSSSLSSSSPYHFVPVQDSDETGDLGTGDLHTSAPTSTSTTGRTDQDNHEIHDDVR